MHEMPQNGNCLLKLATPQIGSVKVPKTENPYSEQNTVKNRSHPSRYASFYSGSFLLENHSYKYIRATHSIAVAAELFAAIGFDSSSL